MNRRIETALQQVQLPEAEFQEGKERVVCSGLFNILIYLYLISIIIIYIYPTLHIYVYIYKIID